MSTTIHHAVADYLKDLGLGDGYDGEPMTCTLERGWSLHLEALNDELRIVILIPRQWDLDSCAERALTQVNLLSNLNFSPVVGLYRDGLLLSLSLHQRLCSRSGITSAVGALIRLGESCTS